MTLVTYGLKLSFRNFKTLYHLLKQRSTAAVLSAIHAGWCEVKEKTRYWKLKEAAPDCTLESSLWKRLWTCHKTDYRMSDVGHEILPSADPTIINVIHSFSSLSYDRSKASSKTSSPHSAIQSFLFQMRVSSPFLNVIQ